MKPIEVLPDEEMHARAAPEKIAADLAFDLGLPVPPVQLTAFQTKGGSVPAGVSLVMYPTQWAWEHVKTAEVTPTVRRGATGYTLMDRA
jgi:hypothetical protein